MFQHDNAPVHTLSSTETWFAKIGVDQFKWPAQSLNLNPSEHLRDELEFIPENAQIPTDTENTKSSGKPSYMSGA